MALNSPFSLSHAFGRLTHSVLVRARLVQVAIEGNLKFSTAKLAGFAQTGNGSSALDEESDDDFVEGFH